MQTPMPIPLTTESATKFADAYFSRPDVQKQLKGALFLAVKDGKVLLNKGYGYADVESKKRIDSDTTVFRMGSKAKVMTTTAVMQLAEQGKIDLDRDISEYEAEPKTPEEWRDFSARTFHCPERE
ncbi:serine hydrolase domain-containing protein [Paenibacillus azoreducens]|uniref:serine hydrolase domain-containing protein n=1 Tax=Paenibacillus azoreducens TaxID=116718 RepID=UPI0039F51C1C